MYRKAKSSEDHVWWYEVMLNLTYNLHILTEQEQVEVEYLKSPCVFACASHRKIHDFGSEWATLTDTWIS